MFKKWLLSSLHLSPGRLANVLLILVFLFGSAPLAQAKSVKPPPKAYPALLQMAKERPNAKIPVIIQKEQNAHGLEKQLHGHGGKVTKDLPLIRGVAAEMPAKAVAALSRAPGIRWISLDAPMIGSSEPVDTTNLVSAYIRTIGADRVWSETPSLQGEGITVAVVDSGIQDWADVKQDDTTSKRILAWAHFSDDTAKSYQDYQGHGSHVAGIIGGNGTLSAGEHIGVAPKVNLVNVKVSNIEGASHTSDVIAGLQWVFDHKDEYNIRVVNLSLNSAVPESYHTSPLDAAVELLWFNGIVVVVSAGNNGSDTGPVDLLTPANDPFVITVGATDDRGTTNIDDDALASFSAYGITEDGFAKPDIVAPGRHIVSLIGRSDARLMREHPDHLVQSSTESTAYYFRMSGTSMAAPMVTGAIALLLQDEPGLTPDQVKYRLMATARDFPGPQAGSTGAGYLDIYAAVHGETSASANAGIAVSEFLGANDGETLWDSVNWNSVNWNSVNWNSVNWNSVNWNNVFLDE